MGTVQTSDERARLQARNIGGIDETEIEFQPGVNLLTGWNASNRTSLLQAIMAAMGSEWASLKGDADSGRVDLELGGDTFTRSIDRRGDSVVFGGRPYTDDPVLADLFAFLLESNEARQAVGRGEDLRDILVRPIDMDAIRSEIETLEGRRREIDRALSEHDRLDEERVELEAECANLDGQIDAKRGELEAKRDEIEAADAELEETRERKTELESKLADLQDHRSTLEEIRYRLETERETAEAVKDDLADLESELGDRPVVPTEEVESLEDRAEELRDRKRALDSRINQLQALIQFNEEMLSGDDLPGRDGTEESSVDDVTDKLLPAGETFTCWTCGEEATKADIEETLEALRSRRTGLVERRREATEELESVDGRKDELLRHGRRRAELENRRERLTEELTASEDAIERLEARRDSLVEEIEEIEGEGEGLREEEYDEIIDLHKAANTLELEIDQLESELDRAEGRLRSVRDRLDELEERETEREEVQERLEEARTRVERIEDDALAEFNEHMAAILDVLGYENIERIWLERVEREVRDGRRKVRRGFFELHVIRNTASGAVYEDTVTHLSESEREVTGLIFALAGYLTHDVHKEIPFMLLDSIEAIDSNRIASLVEYLGDYAEYLVIALLPGDAAAVDDRHRRITDI